MKTTNLFTRSFLTLSILTACASVPATVSAAPPSTPPGQQSEPSNAAQNEVLELIVLFDERVGPPEEIVEKISNGNAAAVLPAVGRPESARFAIRESFRLGLAPKDTPASDSPEERLSRYTILQFRSRTALEAAKAGLSNNPNVLSITENARHYFSSIPFSVESEADDPYLYETEQDESSLYPESTHQWGLDVLDVPQAWAYTEGHAFVGIPDGGVRLVNGQEPVEFRQTIRRHLSPVNNGSTNWTHGTHVAGIIGAATNNGTGVAGICPKCSLLLNNVTTGDPTSGTWDITDADVANAYTALIEAGSQVINTSFGGNAAIDCTSANVLCDAIQLAENRDVIIVAAAGNGDQAFTAQNPSSSSAQTTVDNFARLDTTFAVAALDYDGAKADFSDYGPKLDFLAPGVRILSTVDESYGGGYFDDIRQWPSWDCGDSGGDERVLDNSTQATNGYGTCTGTSMAAPHIVGLVALARSANPLLSRINIKDALIQSTPGDGVHSNQQGFGIPSAHSTLAYVLGQSKGTNLVNRLTPLFRFYSNDGKDSFYTTAPQMASAAIAGTMHPRPATTTIAYAPAGSQVTGYSAFPGFEFGPLPVPSADVFLFSTDRDPRYPADQNRKLLPLYRASFQGNYYAGVDGCDNEDNIDHSYDSSADNPGLYQVDGIEGYMFDPSSPAPAGTVKLMRAYHDCLDDHALYPVTDDPAFASIENDYANAGYDVAHAEHLGWVYLNKDSDGDTLIDGFEQLIGTSPYHADTDRDGVPDGVEFPLAGLQPAGDDPADITHTANFTYSCEEALPTCTFTATVDDADLTYTWDFGDGSAPAGTGYQVSHTFPKGGSYAVTLTVSDAITGQTASSTQTLEVEDLAWLVPIIHYILN